MEAAFEVTSEKIIKPSSPTPHHLKDFKLSFLDQLSPYHYVPVLFFYPAPDVSGYDSSFASLCDTLKASLSDVLTLYYPFCGRIKENISINCNDAGVLFVEAKVSSPLTTITEYPLVNVLKQFLPIDPFKQRTSSINDEEQVLMAIQVSELSCGAMVLGLCISHKIADGVAVASFLNAWVETTKVNDYKTKPHMEASLLFPTREKNFSNPFTSSDDNKEVVTTRLVFDETSISRLRAEFDGHNSTRVEIVTALIWKSMMEATIACSKGQKIVRSFATHIVNIRSRMVPPLQAHSIGNFVQFAFTPLVEFQEDKRVELLDLAMIVKKAIMRIDEDYVSKLVGDVGFDIVMESIKQVIKNCEGNQWSNFTSWTRFPLYEVDFGWGKPTWVSTVSFPVRNNVLLMATKCGKGIEAWVNLDEQDMVEFESNKKLQQYASMSRASC